MKNPLDKAKGYEVVWDQVAGIFESARRMQNPNFVYLIGEEDGPVKIGTATNPIKRLRTMQTGNPRRLRVEWALIGDRRLERMLHRLWRPFAIKSAAHEARSKRSLGPGVYVPGTEWFHQDVRDELVSVICSAVELQLDRLKDAQGDLFFEDFGALVIKAHQEHGFIFSESKVYEDDGWDFVRVSGD